MPFWTKWLRLRWRLLVSGLVLVAVVTWLGCTWALGGLRPDDPIGQVVAPVLRAISEGCRTIVAIYGVWCAGAVLETVLRLRSRS